MIEPTKTDPLRNEWAITDTVDRLRDWGSDRKQRLPSESDRVRIGTTDDCEIKVRADGIASRVHAELTRDSNTWRIENLSKNGIKLDGAICPSFVIEPGCLIGIGSTTLVAESGRSVALRTLLARFLGMSEKHEESVRQAAARRGALTLVSKSNPVALAFQIHRLAMGSDRPFVSCDTKRKNTEESVRSVRNYESGIEALAAARGGSLCLWSSRLPSDYKQVREALRDPSTRVQIVTVSNEAPKTLASEPILPSPIIVPSLAGRTNEIGLIVEQYAEDARREFEAAPEHFLPLHRKWVVENAAGSLAEIEAATSRIVALRLCKNINRAAKLLDMARTSLDGWIERNSVPWESP